MGSTQHCQQVPSLSQTTRDGLFVLCQQHCNALMVTMVLFTEVRLPQFIQKNDDGYIQTLYVMLGLTKVEG